MWNSIIFRGLFVALALYSVNASAAPKIVFTAPSGESVAIGSYLHSVPPNGHFEIDLSFEKADAERLRHLMQANIGSRVNISVGKESTMSPVVRAAPTGDGLTLTLGNEKEFEAMKVALKG